MSVSITRKKALSRTKTGPKPTRLALQQLATNRVAPINSTDAALKKTAKKRPLEDSRPAKTVISKEPFRDMDHESENQDTLELFCSEIFPDHFAEADTLVASFFHENPGEKEYTKLLAAYGSLLDQLWGVEQEHQEDQARLEELQSKYTEQSIGNLLLQMEVNQLRAFPCPVASSGDVELMMKRLSEKVSRMQREHTQHNLVLREQLAHWKDQMDSRVEHLYARLHRGTQRAQGHVRHLLEQLEKQAIPLPPAS